MVISTDPQFVLGMNEHKLAISKNDTIADASADAKRILVVDDSSLIRKMLRQLLEKNDYTVAAEAVNGAEAVELYAEG